MNKKEKELLTIGSLLHNIGELTQLDEKGTKPTSAYEFMKKNSKVQDHKLLDLVNYHRLKDFKDQDLPKDSLAYLVYFADKVAAFASSRAEDAKDRQATSRHRPLKSVFNILNKNKKDYHYKASYLSHDFGINYPTKESLDFDLDYYKQVIKALEESISKMEISNDYIQSLLELMESYMTYIPSSVGSDQLGDISLYEHSKLTAAIASSTYDYLEAEGIGDYRSLVDQLDQYYKKEIFSLVSLDVSGIQNFIYTIISTNALKSLRTRSFYLEIMLEIIIDDILDKLDLTRANLLYSGGGHAYLLIANTDQAKEELDNYVRNLNNWFIDYYGTDLYLAYGTAPATANTFRNLPAGSYQDLYRTVSEQTSASKLKRYDLDQLKDLNFTKEDLSDRECRICKRPDLLMETEDGIQCTICTNIINFSRSIIDYDYFVVEEQTDYNKDQGLSLPFNRVLLAYTRYNLEESIRWGECLRLYSKNRTYQGHAKSTRLWVGDYASSNMLEDFARESGGIDRLSVLRADVDSLGQAFVAGFDKDHSSLTRSGVFSYNMNMFFKYHINHILDKPIYSIDGLSQEEKRKLLIVYSGGDDVFIVGGWKDVIEAALDIRQALEKFSLESLTISAGLGIYNHTYPIKAMAEETGQLEEAAKDYISPDGQEKNAIAIFEKDLVFSWQDFRNRVIEEKYRLISDYMVRVDERGMSFLYNIVGLIRAIPDQRLNIARLAYLLSRLEPKGKDKEERHQEFPKKIYSYAKSDKDRKELIAAAYIYIYMERGKDEDKL